MNGKDKRIGKGIDKVNWRKYDVLCIDNDEEFDKHYNEILEFSKRCIIETFEEERDTGRDLHQTHINMGWKNWETNNECLLYRIYKNKKFSNGSGMYTFIRKDGLMIASSGVELWNPRTAILGKRTFVMKEHRANAIISINSFPIQLKWVYNHNKTVKQKVDICLLTFNEYNRQAVYKTIKKFIRKDFDGDWNFMRKFDWRTFHGKAKIYNTDQMFVYTVLNQALEDIDDKQEVYNIVTGIK